MALRFKLPRLGRRKALPGAAASTESKPAVTDMGTSAVTPTDAPAPVQPRPAARRWQTWLARLPQLPLSPRWLIARTRDGRYHTYRIHYRWDGERRLYPYPELPREPAYLVLDPDTPYRRKLQRYPGDHQARKALLKTAPDEFPLPADTMDHALGLREGDGYLYALPKANWAELLEKGIRPAIICLADSNPASAAQAEQALQRFEQQGATSAFGTVTYHLPRTLVRNVLLALSVSALLGGVLWLATTPHLFNDLLSWQVRNLRKELGDLPAHYRALKEMQTTQQALAALRANPESHLSPLLVQLLATQPPGVTLRSIGLEEGRLKLSGNGNEAQTWLLAQGFTAENIRIETVGNTVRFQAERML